MAVAQLDSFPQVRELLAGRGWDEESVHELHRGLRSDREAQRLARRLRIRGYVPPPEALRRAARRLERDLGALRDIQLTRGWLVTRRSTAARSGGRWWASALEEMLRSEREARSKVDRSARRLLAARPDAWDVARRRNVERLADSKPSQWRRVYRRSRSRLKRWSRRRGRETRELEGLHRFRRELRRIAEAGRRAPPRVPRPAGSIAEALNKGLRRLGRIHDLSVRRAKLRGLPTGRARKELRREVDQELRRQVKKWHRTTGRLRPRQFVPG